MFRWKKVKTASSVDPVCRINSKKRWRETRSLVGGDMKTETKSLDESESSPEELLRINIPNVYTQPFCGRTQKIGLTVH